MNEKIIFKDYSKTLIEDESKQMEEPIQPLKYILKNLKKKIAHIRLLTSNSERSSNEYFDQSLLTEAENNSSMCSSTCSNCQAKCAYRRSEINPNNDLLSKEQVKKELKKHKHPLSRINKHSLKYTSLK